MSDADIAFKGVAELGALLRAKQLSSVELTNLYLRRLQRFGPRLNAIVTLMPERALAEAKAADRDLAAGTDRGPLHGIPYGVKDLLAARGAPTTWGAQPYRAQRFDFDARAVEKLADAGGVLLAKLAMIELSGVMNYNQADASFTGPCKTPWSEHHWSGGSSSGSGACVAGGLVGYALGSETSGSILNPSSYCGATGLRPTYGCVSRYGAMPLSWTLDKVGPITRSADDALTVFKQIAGRDPRDKTAVGSQSPVPAPPPGRRWRLGVLKDAAKKAQSEVRHNFEKSLAALADHASLETVSLPDFPYDAMISAIIAAEGGSIFREIIEDGRVQTLRDPVGRRGGYAYLVTYAVDYVDAMRRRVQVRQAFRALFEKIDAIVAPTFATVAYPIDSTFDKVYPGTGETNIIEAGNLAGLPAISVPNGFGLHGLPTGLSFMGPAFSESNLAALANVLQHPAALEQRVRPALTNA
ncbi:MAG: amidase [Candidatus Eremiobacteraeota bacterium]|nr:amidase [Candidatus Eremiobacteraeota bacterium]